MDDMIHRLWPFWAQAEEIQKVTNALVIAMHQHNAAARVKTRKYTNAPYIVHPIRVALAAATHPKVKISWMCAALLHDTIEDTVYSDEDEFALKHKIINDCGQDVLTLVEELTNPPKVANENRKQRKEKNLARLKEASKPAKILKMLDRIDNLREMLGAPVDFKKLYVSESEELFTALRDADNSISIQLHSSIHDVYAWRIFSKSEMEQKPFGMVFEHSKKGFFFVKETGRGGCLKSKNAVIKFSDDNKVLMRETGTSVKTVEELD